MNESSADVRSLHGADRRTCRNCGAIASEAFCAHCGQETVLRLPTLLEFLREAAGRYVAFDGPLLANHACSIDSPRISHARIFGRPSTSVYPPRTSLSFFHADFFCGVAIFCRARGCAGGRAGTKSG